MLGYKRSHESVGREDQKGRFRRVQNIEYLKELCRRTIKLIVICQNLERKAEPQAATTSDHEVKKSGVPTNHREEDTTGRTSSIQKRQRKKRQPLHRRTNKIKQQECQTRR
ncbi:hypothetical protein TNCV_733451 [Trichonephila clavipes]|nr:hypothetical protein TNCV_733451 [Trichonephila clavipes]